MYEVLSAICIFILNFLYNFNLEITKENLLTTIISDGSNTKHSFGLLEVPAVLCPKL